MLLNNDIVVTENPHVTRSPKSRFSGLLLISMNFFLLDMKDLHKNKMLFIKILVI